MAERMTRSETWAYFEGILTTAIVAEKGGIACIDTATGLLRKGLTSATVRPIGYFDESKTGDGTKKIRVKLFTEIRVEWFANDVGTPIVAADVGDICYIFDDRTVTGDATGRSPAGRVWAVNTTNGVAVEMLGFNSAVS